VIVGDPGSGKTTFLRRIAYTLAETLLDLDPDATNKWLGIKGEPPFPLFLRLADLSAFVEREKRGGTSVPTTDDSPEWLTKFLGRVALENVWGLDEEFFKEQLESGSCMLLLDGLDEAPSLNSRKTLTQLIEKAATVVYDKCQFVLTTRPKGLADGVAFNDEFKQVHVGPLTEEAIDCFLTHWCNALFPEAPDQGKAHRVELDRALETRSEIRRMATNPVMLTALAVVHWNEKRLPEQRADLYESIITWLSRARETRHGRMPAERCVRLLQEVALAMMGYEEGRQIEVSHRWAAEQIMNYFPQQEPYAIEAAERFLLEEELDSGIIVGRGDNLRFWHLSFQEFLAARAIAARAESMQRKLLIADRGRLLSSEWRETVLLFAGILHRQGAQKVDAMLKTIIAHEGPTTSLTSKSQIFGLIGAIQRDLAPLGYEIKELRYQTILNEVMRIFSPEISESMPTEIRLEAADALGQSGDPRLELNNWITIAGGRFLMGVQAEDPLAPGYEAGTLSIERPPHEIQLSEFQISRFLVTVYEFEKFIADNGYQEAQFWVAGGYGLWKRPDQWDNQVRYPNRPIVGISWYEALAYCAWKGYGVSLLTEAQWERAARGLEGRKFPWGEDEPTLSRLNFRGANVGHVTPVGFYPLCVTPDGVYDLAGNVFEWCLDGFGDYHCKVKVNTGERVSSERKYRVVRGGCFGSVTHFVRSAFRGRYDPTYRSNAIGFRICRVLRNTR
jgi:formylglycine-generating enzyme required for sulfatase activity